MKTKTSLEPMPLRSSLLPGVNELDRLAGQLMTQGRPGHVDYVGKLEAGREIFATTAVLRDSYAVSELERIKVDRVLEAARKALCLGILAAGSLAEAGFELKPFLELKTALADLGGAR